MARPDLAPPVSCRYGAPMGRAGAHPGLDPHCRVHVSRLPIDSGGYDRGGAYWGCDLGAGAMFAAWGCDEGETFVDYRRARSKGEALAAWRDEWPNATVQ